MEDDQPIFTKEEFDRMEEIVSDLQNTNAELIKWCNTLRKKGAFKKADKNIVNEFDVFIKSK